MNIFQGFKPSGLEKIANAMGFQGDQKQFQQFLRDNPDRQAEMMRYQDMARKMVEGGYVKKMQEGGDAPEAEGTKGITDVAASRVTDPKLPEGAKVDPFGIPTDSDQFMDADSVMLGDAPTGDVTTLAGPAFQAKADLPGRDFGAIAFGEEGGDPRESTTADAEQAGMPRLDKDVTAETMEATTKQEEVGAVLDSTQAAQGDPNDPRAKVTAQASTKSMVGDLKAAEGVAHVIDSPAKRELEAGEIVEPVANAEKAKKFTEEVQAATATPSEKATVAGQMATLTEGFDATNPPAWAAGALRGVMAQMQSRGMGASSMAGQAMVQAALESALPIASADAQTQASFEAQNLSNRQARAMLAAEQRAKFLGMEFDQGFQAKVINASKVSDIANMNFNAEQQVILENSRAVNTMNLANLSNRQALVMAEASSLANLDIANLNNRQQAQVENAKNFLQIEMTNLSNKQQTELFKSQSMQTALFNDQAAENAAKQFNATSQNQTDQFFANLKTQVSQFNAAQQNAHAQFNAGEKNAMEKFNAEMQNQRDQFNSKNRLVIDQNNAQWRRTIATSDTAAINRANELNATALLNMSNSAYNNLWQYYNDVMEMSWESTENERQRVVSMAIAQLQSDTNKELSALKADYDSSVGFGQLIGTFLTAGKDSVIGNLLGGIL
tara:strand:+ start:191 stop:2197 length:2007 start_codon:yes stop_codon:yes gene_type:complete